MNNNTRSNDHRILLCVPMKGDSAVLSEILAESRISCSLFTSVQHLINHIGEDSEAAIITEEMLTRRSLSLLKNALSTQPEWSNFPLIFVSTSRGDPAYVWKLIEQIGEKAQLQVLERPLYTAELLSAVRVSIQSRQQQYRIRDELKLRRTVEAKLREESKKKNEFLSVLGHELRNPLAALITALELVHKKPDPDRLVWCEQVVGKQVKNLQRLVNDLIDISRITRGKIDLQFSTVEIGEQMFEAAESISSLITNKKQELVVSPLNGPLYVRADPVRLQQIFINLLKNGSFYTPAGGEIRFSAKQENGVGIISVKDTGVGLEPEQLTMIFEPYLEIKPRVETEEPGLGIGLSVVKQLTELHGGTVTAISEGPGKGSEFVLRLPLCEAPAHDSPTHGLSARGPAAPDTSDSKTEAREKPAPDTAAPRSVLIAEDNRDFAELLRETLKEEGYTVTVIENGTDAAAFAGTNNPDYAIIDIGLPDMDGYTVAEKIRAAQSGGQGGVQNIRRSTLIALSGYAEDKEKTRGVFDHYILKGSDVDKLFEILKSG